MVEVRTYTLPPTALVPNSPLPILHYPNLLSPEECKAAIVYDRLASNGWRTRWIVRYGPTQKSHYHSQAHECMTVLIGTAKIRFGVADTTENLKESTYGPGHDVGGIELNAKAGDVFVIPAGTAHKTHDTTPGDFALLSPGEAKGITADDPRNALTEIELSGFTMIGAYPVGNEWDFVCEAKERAEFERSWKAPKPERDPVLGNAREGLCGTWM